MAETLDSDPSHEAGEWGEATLLGMCRHPCQLEDLVGDLRIQLGWGNGGPSIPSRIREAAAQRVEPGVHLDANRITNGNID